MRETTKHHDSDSQRRERARIFRKTVGSELHKQLTEAPPWHDLPFTLRVPERQHCAGPN
jgi:hypothetical protein